ncbi:DEHA2E24046p [Debaryomyces hansenii CBS767]|uniref:DEHA2E24046p n=1 Tax=Debaryomyces hansenii (strain ATCC 36239 / CBS 767 / BCRC 21394 / JCM 1990 / NBRC 0083 / IGC 2968) TaxID=284592 RepID=Q6BN75_DEBHA|nr:DEHA2E24046p [Debaryomyces hansenii CBS767]CAG88634.1 DEHA2E24046p [Debaryomyces hansenii CBS767]|eukprot:XP_460345.1 DEHA2E24046p [Debaryomyces hansenii CBS767]
MNRHSQASVSAISPGILKGAAIFSFQVSLTGTSCNYIEPSSKNNDINSYSSSVVFNPISVISVKGVSLILTI